MKQYVWLLLGLFFSIGIQAKTVVDVYGTDEKTAEQVIKKYAKSIIFYEEKFHQYIQDAKGNLDDKLVDKIMMERQHIIKDIKNELKLYYVDIKSVIYPDQDTIYVTVDVIDKKHPDRMKFLRKNNHISTEKKQVIHPDLIDTMIEFSDMETRLILTNQKDAKDTWCPVYHCISGFNDPKLKPYLKVFNQGAKENKVLIIDTINHDPDAKRRAAAVFLTGHFTNPKEIMSVLLPHVTDDDESVRNNVIRVIGATLFKVKLDIDVTPFLSLLDSPVLMDRNKSLFVLLMLSESPAVKKRLIEEVGDTLIAILALQQPNNHIIAYDILKKISGKNFGEYDIAAWKQWLSQSRKI